MACRPSHPLKQVASRIFRYRERRAYPSSRAHVAKSPICAASGPVGGCDKTRSPSTMYFMIGSFSPFIGAIERANYAESQSMIRGKTWPDCQPTRHSPGPGIVPHRMGADSLRVERGHPCGSPGDRAFDDRVNAEPRQGLTAHVEKHRRLRWAIQTTAE